MHAIFPSPANRHNTDELICDGGTKIYIQTHKISPPPAPISLERKCFSMLYKSSNKSSHYKNNLTWWCFEKVRKRHFCFAFDTHKPQSVNRDQVMQKSQATLHMAWTCKHEASRPSHHQTCLESEMDIRLHRNCGTAQPAAALPPWSAGDRR